MLGVNTREANLALTSLQARIKSMSGRLTELRIGADSKPAEAGITRIQSRLASLAKQMASLTMGADTKKIDAAIAKEEARVADLRQQMSKLSLNADDAKAAARIADLKARVAHLREDMKDMPAGVDSRRAAANIVAIEAELKVLKNNAQAVRIAADRKAFTAQIAASEAEVRRLKQEAADIRLGANIDMGKLLAAEAALLGIEHTVGELGKKELPVAETAMNVFFASTSAGSTFAAAGWKLLTGHLTLFGGALNRVLPRMFTSVAVWHLLADAVIETVAVWAPAIIAVTAFGVAGADAAKEVFRRMQAVHTVMDATGKAVPPLSNNFAMLAKAVRPEVYQLFGDALVIMNKRGGAFNAVATQTGKVIDQLAARFVVAVTSGTGVNKFMENAVNDVRLLGDSIGNFGGIFGAVFRAVPGYAEILLKVGDWMTKVLEAFTQAVEPVIAFGLALHGFFIYGGTAVTLFLAMVGGLVKLTGAFFNFNKAVTLVGLTSLKTFAVAIAGGIANIITYTGVMIGMAASEGVAAAATGLLSDALLILSRVPIMVWITLAAAAIAGLIFVFRGAHSAAQDFVGGLQKSIQNAQIPSLLGTIGAAQTQVAARLSEAQAKLAHTQQYSNGINFKTGQITRQVTDAYRQQQGSVDVLRAAHSQLGQQYQLVSGRVGKLAQQYGGQTQALGLLNLAGITASQVLDKNNANWQVALVQVEATTRAYKAMGVQAGQLGNDLDVLGRTETDQYQATQKLNQAWTAFIGDVTSTQGSFDTVAQGFFTLNDHAGKLTFSLGKLKVKYADQKAAIDSLTPAGIALNQAFTDQIGNIDKLFASWRTAGLANNLFTSGVKDAIAPLVKYATGSKEATAQLVALAQEASYQGPISLQALTKWLGNTHGATQKLKDITNQATAQEALLTGAMQAQGSFIANRLLADINNAILKYNGVEAAARAYGNAVAKSGAQSDAAHAARARLITDIIKSGTAAGDSKGQIAAMITKVLGIPPKKALQIVMTGTGSFSLSQVNAKTGKQQQAATGGYINMAGRLMRAVGGYIDLGSGPTSDDVPAMLSRGEYVIKASSVARYGKGTMDAINSGAFAQGGLAGKAARFAAGGLVPHVSNAIFNGDTSVLTGQYVVNQESRLQARMATAEVAAMRSALAKAKTAAQQAALGGFPGGGSAGAGALAAMKYAMSILHLYGWGQDQFPPLRALWMGESGWDYRAYNAASGATGIPQSLPGSKMAAAGPDWRTNPATQIRWGLGYIRSTYGSPATAYSDWLGRSPHWYAKGGPVQKLAAGGLAGATQKLAAGGVTGLRSRLAAEQTRERAKYFGLEHAFATGPARYRTKTVIGELATLAKRQASEQAAYAALAGTGLTTTRLHHLGATARSEIRTAADKGLSKLPGGHPGFAADLRKFLGQISATASGTVPGGGSGGGSGGGPGIGTAAVRAALAREQSQELSRYASLTRAISAALSTAKKGSWLYSNKTTIRNEMGTLGRRQAAEKTAYNRLGGKGLTAHNRSLLATAARAEAATARDKALSRAEPGWTAGLRYWLAALNATALHGTRAPSGPGPVGGGAGGTQQKLAFSAWIAKVRAAEAHERYDYNGLENAFRTGLARARKGTWLYNNRKALGERLYAVALKQRAEGLAFNDLIRHSTGSVPDLNALPGRIGKLGSTVRAEAGSLQPSLLGHLPGGHPGWVKALQAQLKILTSLTGTPPFNPPWAPGNLGPSHTVASGVLRFAKGGVVPVRSFDSGGLWPSGTLGWNGSGRTETVTPAGGGSGPSEIHLHVHNAGVIGSQQQTDAWLQNSLNRLARTGYLTQAANRATGR